MSRSPEFNVEAILQEIEDTQDPTQRTQLILLLRLHQRLEENTAFTENLHKDLTSLQSKIAEPLAIYDGLKSSLFFFDKSVQLATGLTRGLIRLAYLGFIGTVLFSAGAYLFAGNTTAAISVVKTLVTVLQTKGE